MNEHEQALIAAIESDVTSQSARLLYADWLEEQGRSAEAANWRAHPHWPIREADYERLRSDLAAANGRRRERTLDMSDCVYAAWSAIRLIDGWYACGGATVANAYNYPAVRTVCVAAVRTDGSVRIGVARANAQKGSSLTTPVTGLRVNAPAEQFRNWADQG